MKSPAEMAASIYRQFQPHVLDSIGIAGPDEIEADILTAIAEGTTDQLHDWVANFDGVDNPDAVRAYVRAIDAELGWTNGSPGSPTWGSFNVDTATGRVTEMEVR